MTDRPNHRSLWSLLHPNLTVRLLIIIIFLSLVALGNVFGIYDSIINQDTTALLYACVSTFLYAIPAYGLFKLKPWARLMELTVSVIMVALGMVMILFDSLMSGIFIVVSHGLIAAYLVSNECKRALHLID
jgi:hypothetical protein